LVPLLGKKQIKFEYKSANSDFVLETGAPLQIVTYGFLKNLVGNRDGNTITTVETLKKGINQEYERRKKNLMKEMSAVPFLACTADGWKHF